ncbi:MAG TPA: sigma 54-interacting transcriptional regulator [bacterium]
MDGSLDVLLRNSTVRLGSCSREIFRVGLSLVADGDVCVCGLHPEGTGPREACRSFTASLRSAPSARVRCPEGLTVLVRAVNLPLAQPLLLASQGFLEESAGDDARTNGIPRLSPIQISQFESFIDLGVDVLAGLFRAASLGVTEEVREEAWRDLLGSPTIVGMSPASRSLREALPTAANSAEPLFVDGEPGSGRRMLAAAVHRLGPRAGRPFVAESLAALPESLQEPEIFGAGGTGGLVAEAAGGTLYLGEIERLNARCQELLLSLLAQGQGAPRVIASADADLEEAVRRGRFRNDLAARLRARTIAVQPLRERPEDIPLLAEHLARRRAAAAGAIAPALTPETLETLKRCPWTGNVRELDEELARAAAGRSVIRPEDIAGLRARAGRAPAGAAGAPLRRAVGDLEVTLIEQALSETNWNKSRAARTLGLSRLGLQKKIDRYGIDRRR